MVALTTKSNRGGHPEAIRLRAEETRAMLLASARRLFVNQGYVTVGINEIVADAGVTRGAFYHHFAAKVDLFEAVFREVAELLNDSAKDIALGVSEERWGRVVASLRAYLQLIASNPVYQQILLIQGPAVLGLKRWRALHSEYVAYRTAIALRILIADGLMVERPVEPLANLIQAALNDAALSIADAQDPAAAAKEISDAFIYLVTRVILPDPS